MAKEFSVSSNVYSILVEAGDGVTFFLKWAPGSDLYAYEVTTSVFGGNYLGLITSWEDIPRKLRGWGCPKKAAKTAQQLAFKSLGEAERPWLLPRKQRNDLSRRKTERTIEGID